MRGPPALPLSSRPLPRPAAPSTTALYTRIILSAPGLTLSHSHMDGLLALFSGFRAVSLVYDNQFKYGCAVKEQEFDHETCYTCHRAHQSYFSFVYRFLFNINNVLVVKHQHKLELLLM
ncbi:hypothetical protein GQ55_5G036100 [Panicum hallii var. hallii]|uniref:Uncharacterized protein n=1 Tax=Panicum hallii var. hallii TaxID=1504633 RepID=A0A2T7DCA2_9POAL|nr:hypothetical protein GQ55_5G036100 [Panicum hallii var. hallii]